MIAEEPILKFPMEEIRPGARIFFTDLDGTLLTSRKEISQGTWEALLDWLDAGHLLVLLSGRAFWDVRRLSRELMLAPLPHVYVGGFNGGELGEAGKPGVYFRDGLTKAQVSRILAIAREESVYCQTYQGDTILSPGAGKETEYYRRHIHMELITADDPAALMEYPAGKCLAIDLHDKSRLEALRVRTERELGGEVAVFYSNEYYLEFVPASSGKDVAVRRFAELAGIDPARCLAAGDGGNDLGMLRAAGIGIGMINGLIQTPGLREAADIITEADNNHDGLVPILRQYL